jgi:acyl-CoA thioester hydrolase
MISGNHKKNVKIRINGIRNMIELDSDNRLVAHKKIRAPFYDIDMAGMVWHGHYLKYFELARCCLLDGIGYNYKEMIDTSVLWPVIDTSIRYINPLVLDQEFVVSACLLEWELRLFIEYTIRNEKGVVCTRGKTVQAPVNAKTRALQLGSPQQLVDCVENCRQALVDRTS